MFSPMLASLMLMAAPAAGGAAHPADPASLGPADLERVEGEVADLNPLSTSGRVMPVSLNVPSDFKGVYRIPAGAPTPYAGWFARVAGGVIAVFPQSEYRYNKDEGVYPVVPPGTHYLLGGVPLGDPASPAPDARVGGPERLRQTSQTMTRQDLWVRPALPGDRAPRSPLDTARAEGSGSSPAACAQRTQRLIDDEPYRAGRVSQLLARAASAGRP